MKAARIFSHPPRRSPWHLAPPNWWFLKDYPAKGGGTVKPPASATAATAGTPGSFTGPAPADLATLQGLGIGSGAAWGAGEYVALGDASHAYWDGAAWAAGEAPAPPAPPVDEEDCDDD